MTCDLTFLVFGEESAESTLRMLRSIHRQRDAENKVVLMLQEPLREYDAETQSLMRGVRSCLMDADMAPIEKLRRGLLTVDTALICPLSNGAELGDGWVRVIRTGIEQFPSASCYCGPVLTLFDRGVPDWLRWTRMEHICFSQFTPKLDAGILPRNFLPPGINCCFSGSALREVVKNTAVLESNDLCFIIMQLISDMRENGAELVFLPTARAHRWIPQDCGPMHVLFERSYQYGRAIGGSVAGIVVYPSSWVMNNDAQPRLEYFEAGMLLNLYVGQISRYQELGFERGCRILIALFRALLGTGDDDAICKPAREWIMHRTGPASIQLRAMCSEVVSHVKYGVL